MRQPESKESGKLVVRSIRGGETTLSPPPEGMATLEVAYLAAVKLGYSDRGSYTLAADGVAIPYANPAPREGEFELVDLGVSV